MKSLIAVLLLIITAFVLVGCNDGYPIRDEHRGVLKNVSGYSTFLILEFSDGKIYRLDRLADSDPWSTGQECILQSWKPGDKSEIRWRLRSPLYQQVVGPLRPEKENVDGQPSGFPKPPGIFPAPTLPPPGP